MPEPTPGEVAYVAFDAAYPADRFVRLTWDEQAPAVKHAWEAAAQAVLVDTLTHWQAREAAALRHAVAVVEVYRSGWTAPRLVQAIQALEHWLDTREEPDHA